MKGWRQEEKGKAVITTMRYVYDILHCIDYFSGLACLHIPQGFEVQFTLKVDVHCNAHWNVIKYICILYSPVMNSVHCTFRKCRGRLSYFFLCTCTCTYIRHL